MKRLVIAALTLAVMGGKLFAQVPNGYYDNAAGKSGDELKSALHDIIKGHNSSSYGQIWTDFWTTDNKGDGVVWDMYSDGANYIYYYTNGNDQCGSYQQEGDCYNREHSWPQSWFNEQTTPRTDLHHIFPTDGYVNARRSNYPFGEVQSASWTSQNGSKLGTCKSSLGYSSTVFEPIDEYKGDFARAYFYMSTRYYGEDSNWGSSGMTTKSEIKPWAMTMLLRWSDNDPVSQKEIDRNNAVYEIQNNRNPFVDHPDYAHLIWDDGWDGGFHAITCAITTHGSIAAPASALAGATVRLNALPDPNYEVATWTVAKTDDPDVAITVNNSAFVMPDYDVTVSATFAYIGANSIQNYYLITDADQLEPGRTYLIVNIEKGKSLGPQGTNNRSAKSVSLTNGNLIEGIGDDVRSVVLGTRNGHWTFYDAHEQGYLYAASSTANQLKTQATNDANGEWTIEIGEGGNATIKAQGDNTRNWLRYNSSQSVFLCRSSGSQDVHLFVRSKTYDHTESATLACLSTFDTHIIRSGVSLTANKVVGLDQCNNPDQIILEDGAQLLHDATGLNATVERNIEGYADQGGWYAIAVPFANYAPAGNMTAAPYDLYAYNEGGPSEWTNHKQGDGFGMASGLGYLYAHQPATTLRMAGTLNSGIHAETLPLSYANSDAALRGFNLLGNPTAHDITFTKTSDVSDGYYYLNNSDAWEYTPSNTVAVGRAFLVKANAAGQTVTLNPQGNRASDEKGQYLRISVDDENAYVKLTEGVSMPLVERNGFHSRLYLLSDHQAYVMLVRNGVATLDLCLEPQRHGLHTMTFDLQGLDLDYLHLVDTMTGVDVDVLASPVYTFVATPTDCRTRFRLVFGANGTKTP